MREIKFRGKSKMSIKEMDELEIPHQNWWVKGHLIGDLIVFDQQVESCEEYVYPRWWAPVEPETVGQYTGLKDKIGVEIYEGDIIGDWTDVDGEQVQSRCPVFFDETQGEWMIDVNHSKEMKLAYSLAGELNDFDYEVIGNIHDNPELMKGGK